MAISSPVNAEGFTGNNLIEMCEVNPNYCSGCAIGLNDGLIIEGSVSGRICLSEVTNSQQLADVILKYPKNHPENRHELTGILMYHAMKESFPCNQ